MRIGVCGRNDTQWPENDFENIKAGQFGSIKLMSNTSVDVFKRLRENNPDTLLITRLYHSSFNTGGYLPAKEFVNAMIPVVNRLAPYCDDFQIHNEPNHKDGIEGWGATPAHAQSFTGWFLKVFGMLKSSYPLKRFGFPGLALPRFIHHDDEWAAICKPAIEAADWLGVHCYWQSPPGAESVIFSTDFGLNHLSYMQMYPGKPIHILECGNSNTQNRYPLSDKQQSDEYVKWVKKMSEYQQVKSVNFFILSSPDPAWDGFSLANKPVIAALKEVDITLPHSPPPLPPQTSLTNQDVINAFWRAERTLSISPAFSLMSKTGLNVSELSKSRPAQYSGPPLSEIIKPLSPVEKATLRDELGLPPPETQTPDKLEDALSEKFGIDPKVVRTVIQVESGTLPFVDGKMIIRFEPHIFTRNYNGNDFSNHFLINGKHRWDGSGHFFRENKDGEWVKFHGNQKSEWRAFEVAKRLNSKVAMLSISMGVGQIMGFNYKAAGYNSVEDMFADFSKSKEAQLRGMFSFISANKERLTALRNKDWYNFARLYNGAGNPQRYADIMKRVYGAT